MRQKGNADAVNPSDELVEEKISRLNRDIETWAREHDIWHDSIFFEYLSHTGREPSSLPVISRLCSDGSLLDVLRGEGPPELEAEFSSIFDRHKVWYEFEDHCTIDIYPDKESNFADFTSYFHWQWVCSLIKEDIGDIYEELYSHFGRNPDDLYRLHWRDYEIILAEIFKTQGFDVELGPGRADEGIDIKLVQRDPIGDLLTVVQAKKYAPHNKIDLTQVQALYGAQVAEGAHSALFVTTSTYAPVARRFAARQNVSMDLATSSHVAAWSETASQGIIKDKSTLVSQDKVARIIQEIGDRTDPRIVRASGGYNMTLNEFALVIKESKHAALLMRLPSKVVSDDGYGQRGLEVPSFDSCLQSFNADGVVRVKRKNYGADIGYWDGHRLFVKWDGKPCHFDLAD